MTLLSGFNQLRRNIVSGKTFFIAPSFLCRSRSALGTGAVREKKQPEPAKRGGSALSATLV